MDVLLKFSAILTLFYICYKVFLQKETFFKSNRQFLNIGLLLSVILPWIVIPVYVTKAMPVDLSFMATEPSVISQSNEASTWSMTQIYSSLYIIGVIVFTTRFIIQMISLGLLILRSKRIKQGAFIHVEINDDVSPFSFFNYIVFNPNQFSKEDLDQIIAHETVHARQWHSIDLLISQLVSILNWFNPIAWLYKSAIEQNLEFIADERAQSLSNCFQAYQRLLLKTTLPQYKMVMANNFYNSLIKKRIVMLHKSKSNNLNRLKMILMVPVLTLFLMSFNTKEIVTYETQTSDIQSGLMNQPEKAQESVEIVIDKTMSDQDLKALTSKFDKKGITLKFKGIKRNSADEIIAISITAKTESSSANYSSNSDDGIKPIRITIVDDKSITIGDGHAIHEDHDMHYETKDGHVKIKKLNKGNNVFVYSSDDGEEHEIHGEAMTIIIKDGDEVKEIKKVGKDNTFFFSDDDEDHDVELLEIKEGKDGDYNVIIKKDKDGKTISEWVDKKDGNVWISDKDDDEVKVIISEVKDDKIRIMGGDEDALYIIDGKEASKEDVQNLGSDDIESIAVLKGESAIKKYGEKAKNGAIIIKKKD
ncbi:MAG: hypothetical protein HKO90_07295 [Flavobacteriaceae bacterium]|nr:M56 family metallopeptidase [Bacteroidia bacterium]NNK88072.1 hypothetical protein [Flavobacteriaceae bacterium]